MADGKSNPIVWLDMEMTGLDPVTCVPLQVAVVLTDNDLNEVAALEMDVWAPEPALAVMEPFVRKMHTDNGLLERVRKSDISVAQAEQKMMSLLSQHCDYRTAILSGNSIHQDRRFMDVYFPVLSGFLHYRMIDVSSIKELIRRWYGESYTFRKGDATHTALLDIRESIAELKHYRSFFNAPSA